MYSSPTTNKEDKKSIFWYPEYDKLDHNELEGFDIIIHLAGEHIFGR